MLDISTDIRIEFPTTKMVTPKNSLEQDDAFDEMTTKP
jgi:hypothetical protein